jgi:hypothetical protein
MEQPTSDDESDSDTILDGIEIQRERIEFDDDEIEYRQLMRNILSADDNQNPIAQPSNNYIIETDESDSESECDEMVIISESESEMDISDIDE